MNILICDDRREDAETLGDLLRDSGFKATVNTFYNGYDTLEFIRSGAVIDCCFLDIVMPEMNGIELAREIRKDGYTGEIVFLSSSNEFGPESYTVRAFSYLLKPPTPDSVSEIMSRLEQAVNDTDASGILVKSAGVTRNILHRNISYAEAIKHKVNFRLTDSSQIEVYAVFGEIARELFSDPRFVQCHRSYVVNMQDIAEISEKEIVTHGGARIPVTRSYRETRNIFYKWKFGGAGK